MRLLPRVTVALDCTVLSPVGPVADEPSNPFSWCITLGIVNAAMTYVHLLAWQTPDQYLQKVRHAWEGVPRLPFEFGRGKQKWTLQTQYIHCQGVGVCTDWACGGC